MTRVAVMKYITTMPELEAMFGAPVEASIRKEVPVVHDTYRAWIAVLAA